MNKIQIFVALFISVLIIGNVVFWQLTYSTNMANRYSSGYNQGKIDEYPAAYQSGYTNGNHTGYLSGHDAGRKIGMAAGNQTGYTTGYDVGKSAGYDDGYLTGFTNGNSSGYSYGYDSGYQKGNTIGYENGKQEGYNLGKTEGYRVGENAGYQAGDANGFIRGNTTGFNVGYQTGFSDGTSAGYLEGVKDGAGTGYNIRDPTYAEMQDFLNADQTDKYEYSDDYTCYEFTRDVCNAAFEAGYRCGDVYIEFPASAHAIICFDTVDQGLIFIEPQNDQEVTLTIGEYYSDSNGFIPTTWDDTIIKYGIIW